MEAGKHVGGRRVFEHSARIALVLETDKIRVIRKRIRLIAVTVAWGLVARVYSETGDLGKMISRLICIMSPLPILQRRLRTFLQVGMCTIIYGSVLSVRAHDFFLLSIAF